MHDAVLEMPRELCVESGAGALGAFYDAPRLPVLKRPLETTPKVIASLITLLDEQLLMVIDSPSIEVFHERRRCVWPRYIRSLRALVEAAKVVVPQDEAHGASPEMFAGLNALLEKQRGGLFQGRLIDQSQFTLWTIERLQALLPKLIEGPQPKNKKADREIGHDCLTFTLCAQFHLDAVFAAIKYRKTLSVEIQDELAEGLRSIVNAYVKIKEARRLRTYNAAPEAVSDLPWDEEDERLLASSVRDLNACVADDDC